jgi:hypothetical protein
VVLAAADQPHPLYLFHRRNPIRQRKRANNINVTSYGETIVHEVLRALERFSGDEALTDDTLWFEGWHEANAVRRRRRRLALVTEQSKPDISVDNASPSAERQVQ